MSSTISKKNTSSGSDEIDLARLVGELIDHRKLIVGITCLFTIAAILYVIFATPIYQADALIQVEQKQGNAIVDSINEMLPNAQPMSAPEIGLLESRMILGKTVDELNLQGQVEQNYFPVTGRGFARLMGKKSESIRISQIFIVSNGNKEPVITLTVKDKKHFSLNGDNFSAQGTVGQQLDKAGVSLLIADIDAQPGTEFKITYISRIKAMSNLLQSFKVIDQGKDTGMLNLTYTGSNPALNVAILDNISQNYLEQNISRQAAQDAKSLEFLGQQLPKVRTDLNVAEDKLNEYRQQKDSVDLSMEAKSVLDQIVNMDNQLNALTFREAEISQLYTKQHPTYKALMEKRHTLEGERGKLNKRVSAMPSTQQEVLRLSRDVESGRLVYMQLLNRQQELNIAKSSAIGNVRIIDSALTEPDPVKPNKALVILIMFVAGIAVSIGIVLFSIFLRRGIESPEQLEEIGINVYASVPISDWMLKNSKNNPKSKLNEATNFLAMDNPADLAIEAIRSLRTSLHFAMLDARNKVIMISGASPSAGKTFIGTNLAAIIAQTGKKVLFIDADMRKGYVHKLFNTVADKGLSDYLSGTLDISKIVKAGGPQGIDLISRGQIPPNPAELLMHERFGKLIEWADENYDLVVVDTPPVLAVTDAAIIGAYVGTTLLVARFEMNTVKEMEVSIRKFENNGIPVKGCILNGLIKKASGYYGYGYNHYGYTYAENKK